MEYDKVTQSGLDSWREVTALFMEWRKTHDKATFDQLCALMQVEAHRRAPRFRHLHYNHRIYGDDDLAQQAITNFIKTNAASKITYDDKFDLSLFLNHLLFVTALGFRRKENSQRRHFGKAEPLEYVQNAIFYNRSPIDLMAERARENGVSSTTHAWDESDLIYIQEALGDKAKELMPTILAYSSYSDAQELARTWNKPIWQVHRKILNAKKTLIEALEKLADEKEPADVNVIYDIIDTIKKIDKARSHLHKQPAISHAIRSF